jgi:glycosyltransferase involved in cell wall biosynthesis
MIDVVMLTHTKDIDIFKMTCRAVATMLGDNPHDRMRVILVESNPGFYDYKEAFPNEPIVVVEYPQAPFNYNKALNVGFNYLLANSQYVVIANNDILCEDKWFDRLALMMIRYGLAAASPFCPGWPPHEELGIDFEVFIGTRTSYEFCGWCVCIKRDALDSIRPLDERFRFEFQDVDMVDQLTRRNYRCGLVTQSKVHHLLNKSHHLIPAEDRHGMIEGAREIYLNKQNEQPA